MGGCLKGVRHSMATHCKTHTLCMIFAFLGTFGILSYVSNEVEENEGETSSISIRIVICERMSQVV